MRGVPAIPASVLFMLIEELSRVSRVDTFQVWKNYLPHDALLELTKAALHRS
jgi:hypothetical protein